jgi:alkylhydroperoxidase/carboxymuconolactone decarboxylase family protein YurZ
MRLGVDEAGVTELMAVTEHSHALCVVAGALLLDWDHDRGLVAPVEPGAAPETSRALLAEIATAMRTILGVERIPSLWRVLAVNPHHLEATWRKDEVVMRAGVLAAHDKRRVALAVAMNARAPYMIRYHTTALRHAGESDAGILEILGVVDHFNSLNVLTSGMQVESDIRPPATP